MDIIHTQPLTKNVYTVLRETGYIPIHDHQSGKDSFVLRTQADRYPRFHVYVKEESDQAVKIHLHLDYHQHGWGQRLHDTEYDSEEVQKEGERIKRWLNHFTQKTTDKTSDQPKKPKGFFQQMFGG